MMDLVKKPTVPFEGKVAGAVINEGGVKGYINPMTYIRPFKDRFAAAAYRVQNGKPFKKYLKDIGRKELTPEQMEQYTQGIVNGVLATSQGIQALTQTGKYDPEWSAELGKIMGTIPKETLEYREQFGVERPFRER
jgi:NAD(P)H-dependent FMN reductase